MKLNTAVKTAKSNLKTFEGASAKKISNVAQLARVLNTCLLWEDTFYVDGKTIAETIGQLVKKTQPELIAGLAVKARTQQKLRHAPLLVAREMARASAEHKALVADVLEQIIQRPDELAEFLAIYWQDGKQPLAAQVKKGLGRAFNKFNEYSFAKYNQDGAIKLRDVLFLVHPQPKDKNQQALFNKIATNTLTVPDTWEVALSAGADKKETFTRLIEEEKLGALALLRNLRNMQQAGVDESIVRDAIKGMDAERVLPFRFISAAKHAPVFESELEKAMFKCLEVHDKLEGKTVLLVDISGSMYSPVSGKSDLQRVDAANGLAMLLREIAEDVKIYSFDTSTHAVPNRRGFALAEAIRKSGGGGTMLGQAVNYIAKNEPDADRVIVITDEQSHDEVSYPFNNTNAYMINVASYQNGVGYGNGWKHIDGWSEAIIDYIVHEEDVESNDDDSE